VKLRLLPVVITVVVSSSVLFGGWFMYQSVAMEDPFLKQVAAIDGVSEPYMEMKRDLAMVRVQLEPDASLSRSYREILKVGKATLGSRTVQVEVSGESSDALNAWWSKALFDVAQAMETKQYSLIPERLQQLAGDELTVETEIDENNVYIAIHDGPHSKYVILPRKPAMMGVWPNE
jgi:hypothetical protein